ncbi:MAG: CpXC domain-containing protein [Elusimicrobiota bacterium]|jgi:hypothetical protein
MSFMGAIDARCPGGCPSFETEVWSFIRGDTSPALREAILARECNLLLCPTCDKPFYAEAPYVYFDPGVELLAFVFPESFRKKRAFWLAKMRVDFQQMRGAMGAVLPKGLEPEVFFGVEGLAELLEADDLRGVETEVMEAVAKDLGLGLYRVSPAFARRQGLPSSLPCADKVARLQAVLEGLKKLLEANGALPSFRACLKKLGRSGAALPPGR